MILYLIQLVFEFLAMVVAYLTNPIVVLFSDECGNLPRILRYWQTYDNCLDVEWMVSEHCVPSWAEYDFNQHYIYHLEDKRDPENIIPGYVECIDPNFTLKEKLQRYVCRVCWLYRNSNYGFSYEVNGRSFYGSDNIVLRSINEKNNEQWLSVVDGPEDSEIVSIFRIATMSTFSWFYCKQYCSKFRFRIYVGWKLKSCTEPKKYRAMLAISINPFKPVEE